MHCKTDPAKSCRSLGLVKRRFVHSLKLTDSTTTINIQRFGENFNHSKQGATRMTSSEASLNLHSSKG